MSNFIRHTLIFLSIVLSIFISLNIFQSYFNEDPEHYKKQYQSAITPTPHYDGIILGTSHATHALCPSILDESGLTFHNYALNGANSEFYQEWFNKIYLPHRQKARFCLFAIDFFMFDKNWLWRRFDQDAEYFSNKVFLQELLLNTKSNKTDLIVNRFPFLKYRSQISASIRLKKGSPFFNVADYDRGYISYSRTFDSTLFKPNLKYKVDTFQVNCFKALINEMIEYDIKICFVMTPEYGIDKNEYSKMKSLQIVNEIAKE